MRATQPARGVTLLEMLVVIAIIGVIVALSAPALTAGLAGVRLESAASESASFLISAMNAVERREIAAAVVVSPAEGSIDVFTAASGSAPAKRWVPQGGVTIEGDEPSRFLFYPGGAFPRIKLILRNDRGSRRSVEIDPVTAVPKIGRPGDRQ